MLLKRAREEIILTKNEMMNYIRFLLDKRSSLQKTQNYEERDKFAKGKSVMVVSEIQRLDTQIQLALQEFNLNCNEDFTKFTSEDQENNVEEDFDASEDKSDDSTTQSEYSDENGEDETSEEDKTSEEDDETSEEEDETSEEDDEITEDET